MTVPGGMVRIVRSLTDGVNRMMSGRVDIALREVYGATSSRQVPPSRESARGRAGSRPNGVFHRVRRDAAVSKLV